MRLASAPGGGSGRLRQRTVRDRRVGHRRPGGVVRAERQSHPPLVYVEHADVG